MARWGRVLLSVWAGANLALAVGIVAGLALGAWHAPGLRILFAADEVGGIEPRALATVDALAVFGNACAAAVSFLALVVTWTGLGRGASAAAVLATALLPLQACGFVSDAFLGHVNLGANLVSSVVLLAGLGLLAVGDAPAAATASSAPRPPPTTGGPATRA